MPAAVAVSAPTPAPISRPTLSLRGLHDGVAPMALHETKFLGVFGPLGQAHFVADPSSAELAEAVHPIIASRAPTATPTATHAPMPRSAPSESLPFSLPFDELAVSTEFAQVPVMLPTGWPTTPGPRVVKRGRGSSWVTVWNVPLS